MHKNLLYAAKIPHDSDKASKFSQNLIRQKKNKEKQKREKLRKKVGWGCIPQDIDGKKKNSAPWEVPPLVGDQVGQGRKFRALEANTMICLKQLRWKESCINGHC